MTWSTRQVAELAGTSLRAVRHYHEVGLLDEPERRANGYKSYGVAHLVRILRIKRLADLGFTLAQIAEMGDADEHPEEALRALDAELAGTIERLQRVRLELSLVLRKSSPIDLPPELGLPAGTNLPDADRSLAVVMSRLLEPSALDEYREVIQKEQLLPGEAEFNHLPADADEETRRALAERFIEPVRDLLAEHPALGDVRTMAPKNPRFAAETVVAAMRDLYNPAQLDVMRRISIGLEEKKEAAARDGRD
ncbi:MerR family transcriptional regulator [Nocardiopsis sp. CT-R113]|uniref:MerR family transcriptional regulator n=1 Tax=Nocardiopsis codii TaxID=3065942 RepID=A0ABU7KFX2_9ACTN|nr:MerR family transcriptional regulator [Nocardiopsis sp. CT-R113]MEE2041149.1 MerR family transcriptional regulator [Nocardiopsis sp. CT-R113]